MSKRDDIVEIDTGITPNFGLICTRKCGWIDLGHANPAGAEKLWRDLKEGQRSALNKPYFRVSYEQTMTRLKIGLGRLYLVNAKLSDKNLKRVALSIFMDVSIRFETFQSKFPTWVTDSGFSSEDLVSNLVSFYRAMDPTTNYIQMCEPLPKSDALKIWDAVGPTGATKLRHFGGAYIHNIDRQTGVVSSQCAPLPLFLSCIQPAPLSQTYFEIYRP
jgi:hypothetical protein